MNIKKNNKKRTRYHNLTKFEKKLELIKNRFAQIIHIYAGYKLNYNKYGEPILFSDTNQLAYEIYYYENNYIIKLQHAPWNYSADLSKIQFYNPYYDDSCGSSCFFEDIDVCQIVNKYYTKLEFLRVIFTDLVKIIFSYLYVGYLKPVIRA